MFHRGDAEDAEGEFEKKKKSLRTLCLCGESRFFPFWFRRSRAVPLMKISSRSHLQFLQSYLVTESLQPVEAAFCYSLAVAFIKVVSAEIGISLFAS
jgi:hypothetical protein